MSMTKEQAVELGERLRAQRYGIGAKILRAMKKELPMPNIDELAEAMQAKYAAGDFSDDLDENSKWEPTDVYWFNHIGDVSRELRKQGMFFGFLRNGGLKGNWQFMNKTQYKTALTWDHAGLATHTEKHNEMLTDANKKLGNMGLPRLEDVPLLK